MYKNIILYIYKEFKFIILSTFAIFINILFLILAYKLGFQLLDKYIIAITANSVLASIFYSLTIKSKKKNTKINLIISTKGLVSIIIIFLLLFTYIFLIDYFLLIIFFSTLIFSEFLVSLTLIKYQIYNKNIHYAITRNLQSLVKIFTLIFIFYTKNILTLGILNNIIIIIFTGSVLLHFNFTINKNKKSFGIIDILYTFTGAIIFQLDKLIGPTHLDVNTITRYFVIFKITSLYQIIGSVIVQPIRNLLIKRKNITKEMKRNINNASYLLIFFYLLSNLILIIIYQYHFLSVLKIKIEFNDIIIYNLISLSFILHTQSGFYIDKLYLNNQSQYLTKLNIICIIIIGSTIYLIDNPVAWALSILISQILLIIFSQKIISIFK